MDILLLKHTSKLTEDGHKTEHFERASKSKNQRDGKIGSKWPASSSFSFVVLILFSIRSADEMLQMKQLTSFFGVGTVYNKESKHQTPQLAKR